MRALQTLDEAAELARRSGFIHDEALANELAGVIAARAGRRRMADVYLSAAVRCYRLWGATAKADALLAQWPFIAAASIGLDGDSSTTHTTEGRAGGVDLPSILKAARALSEEVYLDRLLARMMAVVLEVGGAERGAFLLRTDGGLVVRAQAQVGPEEQARVEETPLEMSTDVPAGPVLLASRTREAVVIADAMLDEHFESDPVVKARRIRAAVALPVTKQGRLLGVLYLENDRMAGAFSGARVDLLGLLSAQIAIALENSVLFGRLRQEVADREAAESELLALNQGLEARVRDRTAELFAANAELEQANAELERSNEDLELFASIVSHDLHEPLRTVTGFTDVLLRRYERVLDDDGRRYAQLVVDGGRRMQRMLRGLLDVSRVRSAARPLVPTELSVVLDEVLVSLEAVIRETGALVSRGPLPPVLGDGTQLLQVFQNLVANALKFAGPEPPRVHVGAERDGSRVRVSVRDRGIGIDARDAERIFRIFQRADGNGVEGSGIGLSVVRKIVERHGGRIWVESEVGRGATFHFTLPAS
jgi:signal transduction histidine kinase